MGEAQEERQRTEVQSGDLLLAAELEALNLAPLSRITAGPEADDILVWRAFVLGEEGSPFDGGIFTMRLVFTTSWPEVPPEIRFLTSMFHPGVNPETGRTSLAAMGLSKLGERKTYDDEIERLTVRRILEATVNFLSKSAYIPLQHSRISAHIFNDKAYGQIAKDLRGFEETASRWTFAYAK